MLSYMDNASLVEYFALRLVNGYQGHALISQEALILETDCVLIYSF